MKSSKIRTIKAEILLITIIVNILIFMTISGEYQSICAKTAKNLDYIQSVYGGI